MRIAANLGSQTGGLPVVVLAQFKTLFLSKTDQMLATFFQQAAVGWVGDGLGHHSGINHDVVQAAFSDQARCTGRLDGDSQQDLDTLLANALSPARQARRINGQLGLQPGEDSMRGGLVLRRSARQTCAQSPLSSSAWKAEPADGSS